jgi:hypothetical protein
VTARRNGIGKIAAPSFPAIDATKLHGLIADPEPFGDCLVRQSFASSSST